MISESVSLFQDNPRVRKRVSGGGRGLPPPKHVEKGNDGVKKIAHAIGPIAGPRRGARV